MTHSKVRQVGMTTIKVRSKSPVFGRMSFLFVGSERAGHAAAMYSLIESREANKFNPLTYLYQN
jgi:hypothetical protein